MGEGTNWRIEMDTSGEGESEVLEIEGVKKKVFVAIYWK